MYRNEWHLCFEVYRSTLIEPTYLATPPVYLGIYKTWSLHCLRKHSLNPSAVTNCFCLDTLDCSHSWCVPAVPSTLTGYDAGHQVRALHSSIYYSWTSPEWTTVCHSTPHGLKKFHSSVWFEVIIQVDGDVLFLLHVAEECTAKQPRHLENNDMQAE